MHRNYEFLLRCVLNKKANQITNSASKTLSQEGIRQPWNSVFIEGIKEKNLQDQGQ
jgi:hypothetical protein